VIEGVESRQLFGREREVAVFERLLDTAREGPPRSACGGRRARSRKDRTGSSTSPVWPRSSASSERRASKARWSSIMPRCINSAHRSSNTATVCPIRKETHLTSRSDLAPDRFPNAFLIGLAVLGLLSRGGANNSQSCVWSMMRSGWTAASTRSACTDRAPAVGRTSCVHLRDSLGQ